MSSGQCALAVCGWSDSGKTTLIEAVVPGLVERGLSVAVLKHDVHGLDVDRPGKDSYRHFAAGADVYLQGPEESLHRLHDFDDGGLMELVERLSCSYDLVLVEGRKHTPMDKVWLHREGESGPPPEEAGDVIAALDMSPDRPGRFQSILDDWLASRWARAPIYGAVLIGGKSSRMGRPKHLIETSGVTWVERTAGLLDSVAERTVIVGAGELPSGLSGLDVLVDIPGARGPMSGLLAAMRWAPGASWLVAACDMPDLEAGALEWLVSQRRVGAWAVLPRIEGAAGPEPLLALYDSRARTILEGLAARGEFRLRSIAESPKIITPAPPGHIEAQWRNVNTREDLGGSGG